MESEFKRKSFNLIDFWYYFFNKKKTLHETQQWLNIKLNKETKHAENYKWEREEERKRYIRKRNSTKKAVEKERLKCDTFELLLVSWNYHDIAPEICIILIML